MKHVLLGWWKIHDCIMTHQTAQPETALSSQRRQYRCRDKWGITITFYRLLNSTATTSQVSTKKHDTLCWRLTLLNTVLMLKQNNSCLHHCRIDKLCGRPPQYAPALCKLTFDLLTLKVVSETRVTWATSMPILVYLGLSVLDLGPMYATDRQTDRQTSDVRQHHHFMPPPIRDGA